MELEENQKVFFLSQEYGSRGLVRIKKLDQLRKSFVLLILLKESPFKPSNFIMSKEIFLNQKFIMHESSVCMIL